jgi:hypothetical protein
VFRFIVPVIVLSATSAESSFACATCSPSYQKRAEYGIPLIVVMVLQAVLPPRAGSLVLVVVGEVNVIYGSGSARTTAIADILKTGGREASD